MSPTPSTCPRCSKQFVCGIDDGNCWCAGVDVNQTTRASLTQYYDGCLCPDCLKALEDNRPQVPSVRAFLASQLRRKREPKS